MSGTDDPKKSCFVIMPYDERFDPVLDAIGDAVQRVGLRCDRLDKVRYSGKISEEMVARIAKSTLCIADLTGPNSNVMWEAGYAMALKRPTALISQDASTVPFNLGDYKISEYKLSAEREVMALIIESAIRATLKRHRKERWLRQAAAAAGVVLAVLLGSFTYNNLPAVCPEVSSSRCDLIHVVRGLKKPIDAKTSIEVVHVETFRSKDQEFNKTILGAEEILARVLVAAGLENHKPKDILALNQDGWDQFLNGLKDKERDTLTDFPFVRFAVYQDDKPLPGFDVQKYYFLNDVLKIERDGAPPIKLRIENIYNTEFYSGETEAVALRLEKNI